MMFRSGINAKQSQGPHFGRRLCTYGALYIFQNLDWLCTDWQLRTGMMSAVEGLMVWCHNLKLFFC